MKIIDADKLKKDDELNLWLSNDAIRTGKMLKTLSKLFIKKIDEQPPVLAIPIDTLNEIKAEIENHCGLIKEDHCKYCYTCHNLIGVREIVEIIDKYKAENGLDDEKKAENKRGCERGKMLTLSIKDFDEIRRSQYDKSYEDGLKDGYEKGLQQGREARIVQADRAYQYGMARAWEAARKIYDIQNTEIIKELFGADANYVIHNFTAPEAIKKIDDYRSDNERIEK